MRLTVFGANGPTGRQVVRQALVAGHHVTAVTRNPDGYRLRSPHLEVVAADVREPDAVERSIAGAQAVISTYGVPYSKNEITVYSEGITNITRAMVAQGMVRLVCVTSNTLATQDAPGEPLFWRKVLIPFLRNKLGQTLYDDMDRMERIVEASGLDWTIVRPAGLFDALEPTVDYEIAPRHLNGRYTSRADLAEILIKEATEAHYSRSIIEVITRSGTPSPIANVLKEAFGIGA